MVILQPLSTTVPGVDLQSVSEFLKQFLFCGTHALAAQGFKEIVLGDLRVPFLFWGVAPAPTTLYVGRSAAGFAPITSTLLKT